MWTLNRLFRTHQTDHSLYIFDKFRHLHLTIRTFQLSIANVSLCDQAVKYYFVGLLLTGYGNIYLKYVGFVPPSIRLINPKYSSIHSVTNLKKCFDTTTRNYQVRNYLFLTDEYRDNTEMRDV